MRALFFTTHTRNNEVFWKSLESCGVEVIPQRYDDRPIERHGEFLEYAGHLQPDVIICVGALFLGAEIPNPTPGIPILQRLRLSAPTILLCNDAADAHWHQPLREYEAAKCFSAIVSNDGTDWPGALTKLAPVDDRVFMPRPWHERRHLLGYAGKISRDAERDNVCLALGPAQPGDVSVAEMAAFQCDCRAIVNTPRTGTGNADHVKSRVVEAGLAGACLLERKNSATSRWFVPDYDYVEYEDVEDAKRKLQWIVEHDKEAQLIARNLHRAVVRDHHPRIFWRDTLEMVGLKIEQPFVCNYS